MKTLVTIFVVIMASVILGSIAYLVKNKMLSKIKIYSLVLLICGFLISAILPIYSFSTFSKIEKIQARIENYTEQEYKDRYDDEQQVKSEKFTVLRINIINMMILACTVQYIYTLQFSLRVQNLEQKKKAKKDKSLPQKV